jgi:signal transduction histidine kinase
MFNFFKSETESAILVGDDLDPIDSNYRLVSLLSWRINSFVMLVLLIVASFNLNFVNIAALFLLFGCQFLVRILVLFPERIFYFKLFTFVVFYLFITLASFGFGTELNIINFYFLLTIQLFFILKPQRKILTYGLGLVLMISFFAFKYVMDNQNVLTPYLNTYFPETFLYKSPFHEYFAILEYGCVALLLMMLGQVWHKRIHSLDKINHQFQAVIDAVPFEIAIINDKKKYQFLNKSAIKDPVKRKWLIGKTDLEYAMEYGKNLDPTKNRLKHIEEAIKTKAPVKFDETIRAGDILINTAKYINPVSSSFFGSEVILICTSVDVSEIVQMSAKLDAANKDFSAKNDELKALTYMIGHDLKSPIRNTLLAVQILRKKYEPVMAAKDIQLVDNLESQLRFSSNFLDDLSQYSTVGIAAVEKSKIDMNSLMASIRQIVEPELNRKKARLVVKSELPPLEANPTLIMNLFVNLILNGIKYNESERPTIEISCDIDASNYLWKVCDNGIGIPAENKEAIFQLFNRVKTDKNYEGTGIGLSTCKKIVENYNGTITVDSELNKGTCFYIRLPKSA